jgi:hypothetical protein
MGTFMGTFMGTSRGPPPGDLQKDLQGTFKQEKHDIAVMERISFLLLFATS